ncbi:MAG: nucleoside-diphosphate sugar epimerase/dehydratase [Acidimicrobiales bacterium]
MNNSPLLVRLRFALQGGFDAACWYLAVTLAGFLRFDFNRSRIDLAALLVGALVIAVGQVVLGRLLGLYIHRWRYGTFEELGAATASVGLVTVVATLVNLVVGRPLPLSVPLLAGPIACCAMIAGRATWRVLLERSTRPSAESSERVIVFGAGDGGMQVVRAMLSSPNSPYIPVALLDDNSDLRNLRVKSVRVVGGRAWISTAAERFGATKMIVAIPSASGELIRDLVALADEAGMGTLVLPPVAELFGSAVQLGDIRELTEADLLGRRELNTDVESVAGYLTGRRVLVTGAGGSIGSELCRQLQKFAPSSVIMLDRDESALQGVQISIEGRGLLDSRDLVVASIRDRARLVEVFEEHRPEVVFHAAALKHLSLLEMHPEEGFKTNVLGTQNLLSVAAEFGVATFVNISTDKAADSTSVLGRTKRLAEQLTAHAALTHEGTYLSVRFGNVLGSRGSVIPLFRAQIDRGGPVTVTHPDVTRFFMTIEEACQLVIQAGASEASGEVMVLDMGEPVPIVDLARRLIAESDRPIDIQFTGLRPGEKLHEVLFGPDEKPMPSEHPLISRVTVPPLNPVAIGLQTGTRPLLVDLSRVDDRTA